MNFDIALNRVLKFEFSGAKDILHLNKGEKGLTYAGIYQKAHPKWQGWQIIAEALKEYENIKLTSEVLFKNKELFEMVENFYKTEFWDKIKGNQILNVDISSLIFIFAVNVGLKTAIKKAQKVVGVVADGIVGEKTLKALNEFPPLKFITEYKNEQLKYYDAVVANDNAKAIYLNGWKNRVARS